MCNKRSTTIVTLKNKCFRADACIRDLIELLNSLYGITTYASCCGHGKYPVTIVIRNSSGYAEDFCSGTVIPRDKRFYKKDRQGFFYIPEVKRRVDGK